MTNLSTLIEGLDGPSRAINREVALAVGWVRKTPSEAGRKHPAWYHPDDCRDGKVVMDSLHGTDVWREPLDYVASIDAALSLLPEGCNWGVDDGLEGQAWAGDYKWQHEATAATPCLALLSAIMKARGQ